MSRFELDFSHLKEVVQPDRSRIPFKGNEHRLTRVAFDLFHMDNNAESLWRVQADDDGNEFLVRTYDVDQPDNLQAQSEWSVDADKKQANLTIAYRGMPIHRLAVADFGAETPAEARSLQKLVQSRLAADEDFVVSLIESLPAAKRKALAASFPELTPSPEIAFVPEQLIEKPEIHAGWHALAEDGDVVIAHDGKHVVRFASVEFDISDVEEFRQFIQDKLDARDEDFLRSAIIHQARCGTCGQSAKDDEGKEVLPGGLSSGKPDSDFDPEALAKGTKVELEHTDDEKLAKEIAKDHLVEDPKYYDKLEKMEGGHDAKDAPKPKPKPKLPTGSNDPIGGIPEADPYEEYGIPRPPKGARKAQ